MLPPPAPLHLLQDLLSKTSKWALSKRSKWLKTCISSGQQLHAASPSVPNPTGPPQLCSHYTAVQLCKAILAKRFLQSISRQSFANHMLSPTQPPGPPPHADTQKGFGFGLQLQWLQGLNASTPQTPKRLKNGRKKHSRYLFWQHPFSGGNPSSVAA